MECRRRVTTSWLPNKVRVEQVGKQLKGSHCARATRVWSVECGRVMNTARAPIPSVTTWREVRERPREFVRRRPDPKTLSPKPPKS